jgi:hypothetical protein
MKSGGNGDRPVRSGLSCLAVSIGSLGRASGIILNAFILGDGESTHTVS